MSMTFDFSGQNVFVVGGTSGINYGIAEGFARWGAKIMVASRSQDKVDSAVEGLKALGADAAGVAFDVRDYAAVESGFEKAVEFFGGPIDHLISGAAGNIPARLMDLSPNAVKSMVDIDLMGTFHVMRASFQHLKKPGASVVNISAPQAFNAMSHQSPVCAAKAGVDMVTKSLALEWGAEGIRVNSISPGPIDGTEGMARLAPTEQIREAVTKSVPMRRMGNTDDIAKAAGFLCSDAGGYVSGVVLPVDGGWGVSGASVVMTAAAGFMDKLKGS
jgi:NAD(P)-dependent dehydrogenase (short-subunit alcohol dehydrogenase family)